MSDTQGLSKLSAAASKGLGINHGHPTSAERAFWYVPSKSLKHVRDTGGGNAVFLRQAFIPYPRVVQFLGLFKIVRALPITVEISGLSGHAVRSAAYSIRYLETGENFLGDCRLSVKSDGRVGVKGLDHAVCSAMSDHNGPNFPDLFWFGCEFWDKTFHKVTELMNHIFGASQVEMWVAQVVNAQVPIPIYRTAPKISVVSQPLHFSGETFSWPNAESGQIGQNLGGVNLKTRYARINASRGARRSLTDFVIGPEKCAEFFDMTDIRESEVQTQCVESSTHIAVCHQKTRPIRGFWRDLRKGGIIDGLGSPSDRKGAHHDAPLTDDNPDGCTGYTHRAPDRLRAFASVITDYRLCLLLMRKKALARNEALDFLSVRHVW